MTSYWRKLSSTLITSSVWREAVHTKVVWITMLAMSDRQGLVIASVPGLAHFAGVSRDECRDALECLSSPDPDSSTQTSEGRRIEPIEGGWHLINFDKYQGTMEVEARKQQKREWWDKNRSPEATRRKTRQLDSREREREKEKEDGSSEDPQILGVSSSKKKRKRKTPTYQPGFLQAWKAYPHHLQRSSKQQSGAVWVEYGLETLAAGVLAWIEDGLRGDDWRKDNGSFVPGMQVWLKKHDFSEPPPTDRESGQVARRPPVPCPLCGDIQCRPDGCNRDGCDCPGRPMEETK